MLSALRTDHARWAISRGGALRFPAAVAPFSGFEPGAEEDLLALHGSGERTVLVGQRPGDLGGWTVIKEFDVLQMTFEGDAPEEQCSDISLLGADDIPKMLELTSLVYPSYFRAETATLGDYVGVRAGNALIAMAGVRMRLPGYEEISAICTHLDFRGQGLGSQVTRAMIQRIVRRGHIPFLHTESDNPAQKMYRKLGFETRAVLPIVVLERT